MRHLRRAPLGVSLSVLIALVVLGGWLTTRHVAAPTSARALARDTAVALPADLVPPSPTPAASPSGPRRAPAVATGTVRPLKERRDADVFVRTTTAITPEQLTTLLAKTGGTATLVATGGVDLGTGSTTAIGVNPSTFRSVTPQGTAESTPLWQSVARGDVAVAHTVAKALAVGLGQETPVAAGTQEPYDFRVGAFATTGLPGVGVVVDQAYDSLLDLQPDTGLVLSSTGQDPVVTAALAQQVLGDTAEATPLRIAVGPGGRLTWVAPAGGPITSPYGFRTNPLNGSPGDFHPGIDIGAPLGAPIYAASAGVVTYAGPAQGFGNEVVLSHVGNVQTVYGHMERILVTAGQSVRAGQPIALVGAEGDATGPHLHFEVHVNGNLTDPLAWLIAHGVRVRQ